MASLLPLMVVLAANPAPEPEPVVFRTDVIAALSWAGCNQGACHGSPQGKNGFRLSLRGADPATDYSILTREIGGRRVNPYAPEDSLILQKGLGRVPHQGGAIFARTDPAYRVLRQWIAEGCRDLPAPTLARLELRPGDHVLEPASPSQQFTAIAHYTDGSIRDVTKLTVFTSSHPDVPITSNGLARFNSTGETSILARYLDGLATARLTYVDPDPNYTFRGPEPANFIDDLVFAKQRQLQLNPAAVADDATFLRRVSLDLTGTLPTAEDAAAFLESSDPKKREKLVDRLLASEEFAFQWATKWADVLRGSTTTISRRGVFSFHRYLVRTAAEDRPITQFARELLTGQGNTLYHPEANFLRIARTPEDAAESAAQLFLGIRVQCAKCHNHPFENITQSDYYGLAAYFAEVQFKGSKFGTDDEIVYLQSRREVQNPLTKKPQPPIAFGTPTGPLAPGEDRREKLADWLTDPANLYFAPAVANRIWYHLLGQGIVDPVDDFRDSNPPSNPALLKALAAEFVRHGYRVKPLIRLIVLSKTYQLSAKSPSQSPKAAPEARYFTHAAVKMLTAEQVLDAVCRATGVPEPIEGYPPGTRALEIPEGGIDHPFLQAFSKPVRDVICECAREEEPSLPQVLHLLNNAGLLAKVGSRDGRVAGWLKSGKDEDWLIDQVYLATLTRRPTAEEKRLVKAHLKEVGDREAAFRDLQHALMNLNEFVLRH